MFPFGHFRVLDMRKQEVYFLCCDRKTRAASVQRFTLWYQATIEITQRDHWIVPCSRHIYLCVAVCTHPVRGESHIQCNDSWEVAGASAPFYNEPHRSHVLVIKVALGTTFTTWSKHHFVVIGKAEQQVRKASHCGNKQQQRFHVVIILFLLFVPHVYMGVVLHAHPVRGESHIQHNTNWEVATLAARLS